MEAVGKLAGGVAHDLNNMLTIITGYSNLLLDDYRGDDPSRAQVEHIKKAAERSASLTHQLLAFSRKQYLAPVVLSLNTFITGLERGVRALIGDSIALNTVLSPDLGPVSTDPAQLEVVIMNLMANARDAMPKGGRLTIETRNVKLDESYAQEHPEVLPGAYAMMEVTDTGIGMDKETLSRLFEPFFTTKRFGGGSGLGLATAYGIVKQSLGHIEVKSTIGVGSTFRIYLPVVEALSPVQASDRSVAQDSKDVETILLVEDEKGIRRLAVRVLQAIGYKVLEAENDVDALRLAREYSGPVHLLVTSELLPEMSGPPLVQQLSLLHRDLKVLYLSNSELETEDSHGGAKEGVAFLQKPFTPAALTRSVRMVLDSLRIDD
jgi:CheY-like chemotaxis protein